jgi:hypothetical protein
MSFVSATFLYDAGGGNVGENLWRNLGLGIRAHFSHSTVDTADTCCGYDCTMSYAQSMRYWL